MEDSIQTEKLIKILRDKFGFQEFRAGQLEAIQVLLNHGSLLCIQPTGHGKSLLYQLPSTLFKGITVVISPLLALMRDQLSHLNARFQIPAASINTDQTDEENENSRRRAQANEIKILFIAPEQFGHIDRFQFLCNLSIDLIVVDEAHCISTWGHDFRPDYRIILDFVSKVQLKNPLVKVLGLTATADARTEQDIKKQLSTTHKDIVVHRESMNRPNIALSCFSASGTALKLALCEELVLNFQKNSNFNAPKVGLIYCATRENTVFVAEYLKTVGIKAGSYHAGLSPEIKQKLQTDFISDKFQVLAATNALGMGIDKQNLRFIIHFDVPGSITAYYQEVGRCGRDGHPAAGALIFDAKDQKIQKHFIRSALPSLEDFNKTLQVLEENSLNLTSIKVETGLHPTRVTTILSELVEQKFIKKVSSGGKQVYQRTHNTATPDLTRYTLLLKTKTDELNKMLQYSEQQSKCRMLLLRQSLGDTVLTDKCGHCDVCLPESKIVVNIHKVDKISAWENSRTAVICPSKTNNIAEGIALLDGGMRSSLFVDFMKTRTNEDFSQEKVLRVLKVIIDKLEEKINSLKLKNKITSVVVIPSRTWVARNHIAAELEKRLKIPFFLDLLMWKNTPEQRQGELLNNDQRRINVNKNMICYKSDPIPQGPLLLLDDYIGSGTTLKEAARAIRMKGFKQLIIPLTIASVKWKLGQRGMI